jgi:hypothetical protein
MSEQFDVCYIAQLARLELSADEIAKFQSQLGQVLSHVNDEARRTVLAGQPFREHRACETGPDDEVVPSHVTHAKTKLPASHLHPPHTRGEARRSRGKSWRQKSKASAVRRLFRATRQNTATHRAARIISSASAATRMQRPRSRCASGAGIQK